MNCTEVMSQIESLSGFAAYIPCYEGGNCVKLIGKDGQAVLINKSIKSVMKNILKDSSFNIVFIRRNYSDVIGGTNLMPLPIKPGILLIPFKVRKTIGINDGSFAYIDLSSIKGCCRGKTCCHKARMRRRYKLPRVGKDSEKQDKKEQDIGREICIGFAWWMFTW